MGIYSFTTIKPLNSQSKRENKQLAAAARGDFIPLVEYLHISKGLKVEVVSFGRSTSAKLKEAVDVFTDLEDDPKKFLIY